NFSAIFGGELGHTRCADLERGDLGLQVAEYGRRLAHVLPDHRPDLLDADTAFEELQRRNAQALLVDLGGVGAVAAGRHAADVEVMTERADDGDSAPLVEDRAKGCDVRKMLPTAVRIIGDDDIAILPLLERDEALDDGPQA